MNLSEQANEGYNRISNFLNGGPPWKPVAPSAPGQPEPAARAVKPLSEILDTEAGMPAPAASGSEKVATLAATGQAEQPGPRQVKPLSEILDIEAGVIPLSASGPPKDVEAVAAGYRHVKTLAAILNEEDSQQSFHINVHEIISLNNSPTE